MKHRGVILGYLAGIWALSVLILAGGDIFSGVRIQAEGLASVIGVSAAVPPNEFNTLAAQFAQREKELDAREMALSAREQSLLSELDSRQKDRMRTVYLYLFGFTLVLFLLVLVNYYLDYHRNEGVG
jgi:hypothetical protein